MRTYCNEIGVDFSQILKIADIGNLDVLYNTPEVSKRIAELTASIVRSGKIPLMLGGEHLTTAGALSGVSQAVKGNIGVIYFDAHLDFDEELYGEKWYNGCPFRRAMELDNIKPENLIGIGIRGFIDFPKNQWDYAKKNNITIFTMDDIDELGIKEVTRRAIKIAQENTEVVYCSVDIDVLDPSMAPCSLFHAPGGMTTRELLTSIRMISQSGLVGFDVTEVSTSNDPGKLTASAGAACIAEFIGSTAKYFQMVSK
jgi:arginase